MDDRLATLAAELRAETATRTDDIAGQLRAQTDELIALRTTDLEAAQAAQARVAVETARIEEALRSELEALASLRVDHEPDERMNELAQTVDVLTRNIDNRLETIAAELRAETERVESSRVADAEAAESANGHLRGRLDELIALRATDIEATQAAQAQATHAAAETARIEHALRSELKQTIDALPQSIDHRLESITTELQAEFATRTDDIAARAPRLHRAGSRAHVRRTPKWSSRQAARSTDASTSSVRYKPRTPKRRGPHRHKRPTQRPKQRGWSTALRSELEKLASLQAGADPDELKQTIGALAQLQAETADELTASIATLHETVAATHAQSEQNADACRTLTSRLNDLDQTRRPDTDAAELAISQLHRRLDELMALRATDVETTQAAQARTAAETARIEHGLVGTLGELAVQLDDIKSQLGRSVPDSQPSRVDDEPVADGSDARDPKPGKKRSKQGKGKKKPKH